MTLAQSEQVSLTAEIPEDIYNIFKRIVDSSDRADFSKHMESAIALYCLQNSNKLPAADFSRVQQVCGRAYLRNI